MASKIDHIEVTGTFKGIPNITTYHKIKINLWAHRKKEMQIFICVFTNTDELTNGHSRHDCVKLQVNKDQYDTYFGDYHDAGAPFYPFNHAYNYLKATCKPLDGLTEEQQVGFNNCLYDYTSGTLVNVS